MSAYKNVKSWVKVNESRERENFLFLGDEETKKYQEKTIWSTHRELSNQSLSSAAYQRLCCWPHIVSAPYCRLAALWSDKCWPNHVPMSYIDSRLADCFCTISVVRADCRRKIDTRAPSPVHFSASRPYYSPRWTARQVPSAPTLALWSSSDDLAIALGA